MLGLGFLGVLFFFFGIGACLGLIYATWKSIPVFKKIGRDTIDLFKYAKKELSVATKEGIELGNKDADAFDAQLDTWLEKKGWK